MAEIASTARRDVEAKNTPEKECNFILGAILLCAVSGRILPEPNGKYSKRDIVHLHCKGDVLSLKLVIRNTRPKGTAFRALQFFLRDVEISRF